MSVIASSALRVPDARQQLRASVTRFAFARRRVEATRLAACGLALGGLLAAVAGSAAQIFGIDGGLVLAVVLCLSSTLAAAAVGWLRQTSATRLTLEIDRRLDLDERVTTALELASHPARGESERTGNRSPRQRVHLLPMGEGMGLAEQQISDTIAHIAGIRPGTVYPLRLSRRLAAVAALGVILTIAPWLVPWQDLLGSQLPASRVAQATQTEAGRLETVAKHIEDQTSPADRQTRDQIATQLRQAAADLRRSGANSQQASQNLLRAEQAMAAVAPRTGEDAALTLARIADALNNDAMTQAATRALDQQNVNQAATALQQLAATAGSMSPDQRQEVANALQAASNAARGSDTSAAQQLQQAAQAAKNGDAQGMQQAAQALQQLGAANQSQRDVAAAQSELQASREAISQANQAGSAAMSQANAQSGSSGNPSQSDQASGNQPGGSQTSPSDQSGGDQAGASSQSGQGNQQGGQPDGGAGTGSADHLGAASDLQGLAQRQVTVPSDQSGDPTLISASNQLQQGAGGSTAQVDYLNVLPQYRQQALQVIEGNVVPTGLKQVVKGYFDSLAPAK